MLKFLLPAVAVLALAPATAAGHDRDGRIAWSRLSADFSSGQIVSARPDGRELRVLTFPPPGATDLDPKWSPDGRRIIVQREYADRVEIIVMNADGRDQHIVNFGCTDPCVSDQGATWAPDSRHIAFTRVVGPFDGPDGSAGSAALWVGRDDGSRARRLSPLDIDGVYEDVLAEWAPDGSYIQFLRGRGLPQLEFAIFRMRPDGSGARQLTPWELDADMSDLSSNGVVVFETRSHRGEQQNIATVPADCPSLPVCTRQIRYLTANAPDGSTSSFNPGWSPDGSRVVFTETANGAYGDIFTADARGRDRRRVSAGPLHDFRPNWGARLF